MRARGHKNCATRWFDVPTMKNIKHVERTMYGCASMGRFLLWNWAFSSRCRFECGGPPTHTLTLDCRTVCLRRHLSKSRSRVLKPRAHPRTCINTTLRPVLDRWHGFCLVHPWCPSLAVSGSAPVNHHGTPTSIRGAPGTGEHGSLTLQRPVPG